MNMDFSLELAAVRSTAGACVTADQSTVQPAVLRTAANCSHALQAQHVQRSNRFRMSIAVEIELDARAAQRAAIQLLVELLADDEVSRLGRGGGEGVVDHLHRPQRAWPAENIRVHL